jgi:Ca-activated chloride channel family protein
LSSKTPQPKRNAPPPSRARALVRLTLLLSALCVTAGAAAQQPGPSPSQTPRVRPRTVGPKAEAAPAPETAQPATPEISEAVDEDEVVRVESNLVLIPASVVDTRGRAVADLRLEDFELKVDGEPRPITDLSRAETPVNIALLFDNSKSLSAAREFEKQAALRFFRAVIRPIDRAAIYSFANSPKLELPFTNNVPGLVRTIENFGAPAGATALFDTIAQAADYISPLAGRKVIVLVSDGADTLSDINFDEALNRTLRAECQIYVVQTRQIEDPNLHDEFSERLMEKLTEQTGGAVFVPRSVEDLDAAFAQISHDLSQQYVLSYNPQEKRKDNYFRFINVSVKTRPNLRVRARKGFYPNGAQPGVAPPDAAGNSARGTKPKPGNAATPSNVASNASRNRGARGNAPARTAARSNSPGRVGPASPDEEERPRAQQPAAQLAEESQQTLTLTVAESVTAPVARPMPEPTPQPTPQPTPARADAPSPPPSEVAAATPSAPGKKEAAKKVPVSAGVLNGKALTLPRPGYPPMAKSSGITGTVIIEVTIDERGNVSDVRVLSGHPMLQQAALSAARQAKFSPTILSGEPVRVKGTINYTFNRP